MQFMLPSLHSFIKAFQARRLKFEPVSLDYIADKAIELKLGARGLRSIIEHIVTDAMFDLTAVGQELTITENYAKEKCKDILW